MVNADTQFHIIVAILVIVIIMLIFMVEIYRNLVNLTDYYQVDVKPPKDLEVSQTFLQNQN